MIGKEPGTLYGKDDSKWKGLRSVGEHRPYSDGCPCCGFSLYSDGEEIILILEAEQLASPWEQHMRQNLDSFDLVEFTF